MALLSDAELRTFQDTLNAFEPFDVHEALSALNRSPAGGPEVEPGTVASGPLDFGSVEPGVLIYRLEPDKVRIRITVAEMSGGYYDELEVADANVRGIVDALVATLGDEGASHANLRSGAL